VDLTALTLLGRARYQVLACLFALKKDEALHLREIARRSDLSPTATQYELRLLVQTGLVGQEPSANRTLYRANGDHPIAKELRAIVRKTNASNEPALIADDAHWATKRLQQRADYKSNRLVDKSTFLARPDRIASLTADFRIKR
jgi:hypothetical protein